MDLAEALKSFQDHAAVNFPQTQRQASRAWEVLRRHLTRSELSSLGTAWSHATTPANASRAELDEVCAEIREARGL
jgi:hypothetical protein